MPFELILNFMDNQDATMTLPIRMIHNPARSEQWAMEAPSYSELTQIEEDLVRIKYGARWPYSALKATGLRRSDSFAMPSSLTSAC
jgi:hypothetical protein